MTLHDRISEFIAFAKAGDELALSKGACIEQGTGLILGLSGSGFYLLDGQTRSELGAPKTEDVLIDALCWSHDTGVELNYE